MNRQIYIIAASLLLVSGTFVPARADYYVSPTGNDAAAGTEAAPFASPEQARDAIRADRAVSGTNAPAVVWLAGGDYFRTNTFSLAPQDSNTRYCARPGEVPRFIGGQRLDPANFSLVTPDSPVWSRMDTIRPATGQVWQIDLAAQGITDFGTLKPRGFGTGAIAPMELSLSGIPLTLARWPDTRCHYTNIVALSTTSFKYRTLRPSRWTQAPDMWIHGYFFNLWADSARAVSSVDTNSRTITLATEPDYGMADSRPYFVFNLLEELDLAGEYYIDRSSGILYYWPLGDLASSDLTVSVMEIPMLQLDSTTNVTVSGVTFEGARGELVRINSGSDNLIYGCRLLGAGNGAAYVSGFRNGIERCDILDAGSQGVLLTGGIRASNALVRGENFVRQCEIANFGRLTLTYAAGVNLLGGMGNSVEHCSIHESGNFAVYFNGNEQRIEYNELFNVLKQTSDAGVIYAGRDWGARGNVIRYNFIHDCKNSTFNMTPTNMHAVYLDDCLSGNTVFGNIIYKIQGHALLNGGGRDNVWENNVVADCGFFHHGDGRGTRRITTIPGDSWNLLEKIQKMNYQQPPWSTTYPALAEIPNSWAEITNQNYQFPGGTVISRNVNWNNKTDYDEKDTAFAYYAEMTNNIEQDPLFVDLAGYDLTLSTNSPAFDIPGFQPIPFHNIGITTPFAEWQWQHFGSTNDPQAAADADPLGKGLSNYQQFLAGLNPTNPADLFKIVTAEHRHEGGFRVAWSSIGGMRYRLQYSDGDSSGGFSGAFTDLPRGSEVEIAPAPSGQPGTMEFIDDFSLTGIPPHDRRYYRVRLY